METMSLSSSSLSAHHEASTFDELSMQQSLLFMDSLKDLRNLRSQLYSAAEYFESSYTNDDQKEIVVNTLKDYAVKALVNTVDHLGSVSYKVNGLLDEKVDEVAGTELRVSCIEQRLRTCQEYIDREGLSQQSLVITAPKYHKRYVLPGTASPKSGTLSAAKYQESTIDKEDGESRGLQTAARSTIRARLPPSGKLRSLSPSQRGRSSSPSPKVRSQSPCTRPGKFSTKDKRAISPLPTSNPLVRVSATDKRAVLPFPPSNPLVRVSATDKRSVSPLRSSSPFARSGSLSSRSNVLNSSGIKHRYPTEPQKSASLRLHAERNDNRELEHSSSKSRSFLKSLLTRRRSRKDEMLYSYLDEY